VKVSSHPFSPRARLSLSFMLLPVHAIGTLQNQSYHFVSVQVKTATSYSSKNQQLFKVLVGHAAALLLLELLHLLLR